MFDSDVYKINKALDLIDDLELRKRVRSAIFDRPAIADFKRQIDGMTKEEMEEAYVSYEDGHVMFTTCFDHFVKRYEKLGGSAERLDNAYQRVRRRDG